MPPSQESQQRRLAQRVGDQVTVYDTDPERGSELTSEGISFVTGQWSFDLLDGVDVVVTSPGVPERALPIIDALEAGLPVWSELEYAWRHLEAPVVAVTGTNGKTTVTSLIADMAARDGSSDRGRRQHRRGPLRRGGPDMGPDRGGGLEFSAAIRGDRSIPSWPCILNVAHDHLDWHGSYEAYAEAKARIFEHQTPEDTLVYDVDDEGASSARQAGRLDPGTGERPRRPRPDGVGVRGDDLDLPASAVVALSVI